MTFTFGSSGTIVDESSNTISTSAGGPGPATPTITLSADTNTIAENGGVATLTATASSAVSGAVTVTLAFSGTATTTTDYTPASTTITIADGAVSGSTTITGVADSIFEGTNELVVVDIASVSGGSGATEDGSQQETITITDAQTQPTLSIDDVTVNEGDSGSANATFTVTLSGQSAQAISVAYANTGGSATAATDFTAVSGTLNFAATDTSETFTVPVLGDAVVEADETVILTLSSPTNATLFDASGLLTVTNDDSATVTIADVATNEDNGTATITLSVDKAVDGGFAVDVATSDGSATTADTDYVAFSGTETFTGTASEQETFVVTIGVDTKVEANETVNIAMSNLVPSTVASSAITITDTATLTLTNDDSATVTIADVATNEDNGTATITLVLDNAVDGGFAVGASTSDGTATTADGDYTATSVTETFAGTASEQETFTVALGVDTKVEANETIIIGMSNLVPVTVASGAITINDTATLTLTNDDSAAVTIADVTASEADGTATITLTLDNDVDGGFDVDVATADNTATTADGDYTAVSGTEIFAGTSSEQQIFTVAIGSDTKVEANEVVDIAMSNLVPVTVASGAISIVDTATLTINNDDSATVTIADVSGNEDDGAITVTATLDRDVDGGFEVNVSTADGTATTADSDYTPVSGQKLTFVGTASETQTFTVTPIADATNEGDEALSVSMSTLSTATVAGGSIDITDGATITILDDDAPPAVTSVTVPSNGTFAAGQALVFTVNFDKAVTVTGNPQLSLTVGSTTRQAAFTSGSGSSALVFSYTVQAGDEDTDGIAVGTLSANGGTLRDGGGNDAVLTLNSVGSTTGVLVDGIAPVLTQQTAVTTPTTDNTPDYVFSSTEAGTITYGGSCQSVTSSAASGNNTVALDSDGAGGALADGTFADCTITVQDAAGNNSNTLSIPSFTVDATAPTLTSIVRSVPTDEVTNADTLRFLLTFSEGVTGVAQADFAVSGLTGASVGSSTVTGSNTVQVTVSGGNIANFNGTVGVGLSATASITDIAGNALTNLTATGTTETYTLDNTAPAVTSITRGSPANADTNADTLVFNVTFDSAMSGLSTGDFEVTGGVGSVASVSATSGISIAVTVSGNGLDSVMSATVGLAPSSSASATDAAGNTLASTAPTTNQTYSVDNVAPSVQSITRSSPSDQSTASDSLVFAVTLSEAVTSLATADFAVSTTPGSAGTVSNVATTANPLVYNVTVSGNSLDSYNGTVGLNIAAAPTAADAAGNTLSTTEPGTDETYTLDNDQPSVTSITRSTPTDERTNADSLTFQVNFSETVFNVDAADFESAGITGASVAVAAASGTQYNVTLTGAGVTSGNGAITLGFAAGQNIADGTGNTLSSTTPTGANEGYVLDNTAPTVASIQRASGAAATTNADTLVFLVTFSEAMSAVSTAGFTVNGTAGAVSATQNFTPGVAGGAAGSVEVVVSGNGLASFDGTIGLNVAASSAVTDTAGNALVAGEPTTDETYTVDNTAPTVTAIERKTPTSETTNADTLVFQVTFDEDVTGVTTADFVVNGSAGAVSSVGNATARTVDVTLSGSGLAIFDGVIGLNLAASPSATDTAGNTLAGTEPATDETYTLDNAAPSVSSIARGTPTDEDTNADSLVFAVTFSDPMASISIADFTVNGGAGAVSSAVLTSTTAANVTVSGNNLATHTGTIGLDVAAAPSATDLAGNTLSTGDPATDETYAVDNTAPTVGLSVAAGAGPFAGNFDVTVTFSEAVTGFDTTDVSVGNGSATAITGTGAVYTVTITPAATGSVTVDVAGGAANDAAGNANTAATQLSRSVDLNAPTVTITAPTLSSTNVSGAFQVTMTFSEAVTGFVVGDIDVGNGSASALAGGSTVYTATITPNGDGAVTVDIPAGVAQDTVGNLNTAATQFTVTNDETQPTLQMSVTGGGTSVGQNFSVDMNFSEDVILQLSDITVTNGTPSNLQVITGSGGFGSVWRVDVAADSNLAPGAAVTIEVANTAVTDTAGNNGTGTTSLQTNLDTVAPEITLSSTSTTVTGTFVLTLTANEALDPATVQLADFVVQNGTPANLSGSGSTYTVEITPTTLGQTVDVSVAAGAVADTAGNVTTTAATFSVLAGSPETEFAANRNEIIDTVQGEARRRLENEISANAGMMDRTLDRFVQSFDSDDDAFRNVPLDVSGSLSFVAGQSLDTSGTFFGQSTRGNGVLRTAMGQFDITADEDDSWTVSLSGRITHEWAISEDTRLGYFYGGSVSHGDIEGTFSGDSSSLGFVLGGYGLTRLSENLFADGYLAVGYARTRLDISNGTLTVDGTYGAVSTYAGASITGSKTFANGVELRPTIEIDYGRTEIGLVGLQASAFGLNSIVNNDFGSVSVLEVSLKPEFIIPINSAPIPTTFRFEPGLVCRSTTGRVDSDECGAALALGVAARSDDGLIRYGFDLEHQDTGSSTQTKLGAYVEVDF